MSSVCAVLALDKQLLLARDYSYKLWTIYYKHWTTVTTSFCLLLLVTTSTEIVTASSGLVQLSVVLQVTRQYICTKATEDGH